MAARLAALDVGASPASHRIAHVESAPAVATPDRWRVSAAVLPDGAVRFRTPDALAATVFSSPPLRETAVRTPATPPSARREPVRSAHDIVAEVRAAAKGARASPLAVGRIDGSGPVWDRVPLRPSQF